MLTGKFEDNTWDNISYHISRDEPSCSPNVETDALTNLFDVYGLIIYLWTEVSHAYGLELAYIYRLQLSCLWTADVILFIHSIRTQKIARSRCFQNQLSRQPTGSSSSPSPSTSVPITTVDPTHFASTHTPFSWNLVYSI